MTETIHAGCMALWAPGRGWLGVLIEGEPGSGKSDLALRLLGLGFRLVSDDRTLVWRSGAGLFAACPPTIRGMMEARGLGLIAEPSVHLVQVVLMVRCEPPRDRLPEPESAQLLQTPIPLLRLSALEASAPEKLRRAILALGAGPQGAYLAGAVEPRGGSR